MRAHAQAARAGLGGNALFVQETRYRIGIVAMQVQHHGAVGSGRAGQHRASQTWLEGVQELHGLHGGFATLAQCVRLRAGIEPTLLLASHRFDLRQSRPQGFVVNAQARRRLAPGMLKVVKAALAEQTRRFLSNQLPFAFAMLLVLAGPGHRVPCCC